MLRELDPHSDFIPRHIGPGQADQAKMLAAIGVPDLHTLIQEVVPPSILKRGALNLPASRSEADALAELKQIAGRRSEEHTSELQSLMRISYAVICLKKKISIIHT